MMHIVPGAVNLYLVFRQDNLFLFICLYLAVWLCLKKCSENSVLLVLLQIGATDLTVCTLYTVHFSHPLFFRKFSAYTFTQFFHPIVPPFSPPICPLNFFTNFHWLNIFTQFSNTFFHPILLQMLHLSFPPIFFTHFSTIFYTKFFNKIIFLIFPSHLSLQFLIPNIQFCSPICLQSFSTNCSTICPPYFSTQLFYTIYQPTSPPQLVQYQVDPFWK